MHIGLVYMYRSVCENVFTGYSATTGEFECQNIPEEWKTVFGLAKHAFFLDVYLSKRRKAEKALTPTLLAMQQLQLILQFLPHLHPHLFPRLPDENPPLARSLLPLVLPVPPLLQSLLGWLQPLLKSLRRKMVQSLFLLLLSKTPHPLLSMWPKWPKRPTPIQLQLPLVLRRPLLLHGLLYDELYPPHLQAVWELRHHQHAAGQYHDNNLERGCVSQRCFVILRAICCAYLSLLGFSEFCSIV